MDWPFQSRLTRIAHVENGAGLRHLQELLGHASLSTTQVYTHLSLRHLRDTLVATRRRHSTWRIRSGIRVW